MKPPSMLRRNTAKLTLALALLGAAMVPASAQTKLRVNYIPIFDVTPMFVAIDKGYFAEEGLAIEPTPSTGGAAGIPGLMAGAYDLLYGNVVSTFLATQQNFKLKVVAPGTHIVKDEPEGAGIVSRKADAIRSGKDLEGKTLAVNTRNGVIWLYAWAWVRKSGGDPAKVTFKEVPFPQMLDALRAKQVDAVYVVDPFFANATNDAAMDLVVRPYSDVQPGVEVGQYVTTADFHAKNPAAVQKFYRALVRGIDWYNKNLSSPELHRIIAGFTKMRPEVVALQKMHPMQAKMDVAQLAKTLELMREAGMVRTAVDIKSIVDPAIAK